MRTPLCDEFGIDYPIFAFTPSEHVAAAVCESMEIGFDLEEVGTGPGDSLEARQKLQRWQRFMRLSWRPLSFAR